MISSYTQFVLNNDTDDEEILQTSYDAAVVVPEGTQVAVDGYWYVSQGSTIHVDNARIAVVVALEVVRPKENPTHEERIRTAAAALPGITEEQLSLWYDEQRFDQGVTP